MTKRLRVSRLIVQPVLEWDDAATDELSRGPDMQPVAMSVSQAREFLDALAAQVVEMQAHLERSSEELETVANADGDNLADGPRAPHDPEV